MGSRRARDNNQTRSLHCRGYDTVRIGEKELREVFSAFGKVIDVYLPKDFFTKRVRGFAYIQFESEDDADAAREKLDRTDIFKDNHTVNIMWAAGERKTPADMRRLDIERGNPHARRARERERMMNDREFGRRDRSRERRDWDRPRPRDWDGPSDRYRDRSRGYGYGGRMSSHSPPPRERDYGGRFDDRGHRRDYRDSRRDRDDRDGRYRDFRPDYSHKRGRSRSPSFDNRDHHDRKRRRSASRSPPLVRRRSSLSPPRGPVAFGMPDRARGFRSRSRSPTPPKSRSPLRNGAEPPNGTEKHDRWREHDSDYDRENDRGRPRDFDYERDGDRDRFHNHERERDRDREEDERDRERDFKGVVPDGLTDDVAPKVRYVAPSMDVGFSPAKMASTSP